MVLLSFWIVASLGCTTEDSEIRAIRAHDSDYGGVAHAQPAFKAERHCQRCHGVGLKGGEDFIPSCFSCHGRNWLDEEPELSLAPATHTILQEKWRHHPGLLNPTAECVACHGDLLQGTGENGSPGCLLCHDTLWQP